MTYPAHAYERPNTVYPSPRPLTLVEQVNNSWVVDGFLDFAQPVDYVEIINIDQDPSWSLLMTINGVTVQVLNGAAFGPVGFGAPITRIEVIAGNTFLLNGYVA